MPQPSRYCSTPATTRPTASPPTLPASLPTVWAAGTSSWRGSCCSARRASSLRSVRRTSRCSPCCSSRSGRRPPWLRRARDRTPQNCSTTRCVAAVLGSWASSTASATWCRACWSASCGRSPPPRGDSSTQQACRPPVRSPSAERGRARREPERLRVGFRLVGPRLRGCSPKLVGATRRAHDRLDRFLELGSHGRLKPMPDRVKPLGEVPASSAGVLVELGPKMGARGGEQPTPDDGRGRQSASEAREALGRGADVEKEVEEPLALLGDLWHGDFGQLDR